VETVSARDFVEDRLGRPGRWIVDFTADWCPYCRAFLPTFLGARGVPAHATRALGDVTDVDSPLWESLALDVVPTVVCFDDGRPVRRLDGVLGEGLSGEALDRFLAKLPGGRPG